MLVNLSSLGQANSGTLQSVRYKLSRNSCWPLAVENGENSVIDVTGIYILWKYEA